MKSYEVYTEYYRLEHNSPPLLANVANNVPHCRMNFRFGWRTRRGGSASANPVKSRLIPSSVGTVVRVRWSCGWQRKNKFQVNPSFIELKELRFIFSFTRKHSDGKWASCFIVRRVLGFVVNQMFSCRKDGAWLMRLFQRCDSDIVRERWLCPFHRFSDLPAC